MSNRCLTFAAVAAVAALAACRATPAPTEPSGSDLAAEAPAATQVSSADVVGYWSGDRGRMVLRADRGRILGVYEHDDGTLVGKMVGDTLIGWWCEAPSRAVDANAGDVELTFVIAPDGARRIDGRWRHGTDEAWRDDWDLGFDPGEAPPALTARFEDRSSFCDR